MLTDRITRKVGSYIFKVTFTKHVTDYTPGSRGYFLTGPLVFMEMALIHLSMNQLSTKDYMPILTPFFMKKEAMNQVSSKAYIYPV